MFNDHIYDWIPSHLRKQLSQEANELIDAYRFEALDGQSFHDEFNAGLKAFWEDHADELGVPVGAECLVTSEFLDYLLYGWGWKREYLSPVKKAGYVIVHYGGGGAALTLPDGGWIGAVPESFDMVKRMRDAWVAQNK